MNTAYEKAIEIVQGHCELSQRDRDGFQQLVLTPEALVKALVELGLLNVDQGKYTSTDYAGV
jgi:hypothetical protein